MEAKLVKDQVMVLYRATHCYKAVMQGDYIIIAKKGVVSQLFGYFGFYVHTQVYRLFH